MYEPEEYLVEERRGLRALLSYDEWAESPREWANLGTMYCWHRSYTLGDTIPDREPGPFESLEASIRAHGFDPERDVWGPLYLLDHSGLAMSTGRFVSDSAGWDTSLVGFIICSQERIRSEYGVSRVSARLREAVWGVLLSEVREYSEYLSGECYSIRIDDPDGPGDCIGGYIGREYAEEEARRMLRDYEEYHRGIPLPLEGEAA